MENKSSTEIQGTSEIDSLLKHRLELYGFLIGEKDPVVRHLLQAQLSQLDQRILCGKDQGRYQYDEF